MKEKRNPNKELYGELGSGWGGYRGDCRFLTVFTSNGKTDIMESGQQSGITERKAGGKPEGSDHV